MSKSIVSTDKAPAAIGPYSQAVVFEAGKMVITAGQIAINPADGSIPEGIQAQTERALLNARAILEAAGSSLDLVVKTTVFLKDMNDFADMNEVYRTFFPEMPPARSAVEVSRLPKDVDVEIECIALVK